MNEQVYSPDPFENEAHDESQEAELRSHEVYAGISIRGLELVFRIGARNATRTWKRMHGRGIADSQDPSSDNL